MKIISVVGARPNFMKIAPFIRAIDQHNQVNSDNKIEHILLHTGQHYDDRMSKAFFQSLNIPDANINLNVGSGSHAEQVGNTMIAFEKVLFREKPDWVVVVGDVNATLACSVTAKKLHIKVCHIEAGLRSRDMEMPEEINRLVTDRLSDLLLTPDELSIENLRQEGVEDHRIHCVGNIMIDTVESNLKKAAALNLDDLIRNNLYKNNNIDLSYNGIPYVVLTMHRPSNVDKKEILEPIINFLLEVVLQDFRLIWPIHPRTEKKLIEFGLFEKIRLAKGLILLEPVGYHEMLKLNMGARVMLTDSGGLQEECCVLGTPCLTLRWNTERPITLKENGGASILVGNDVDKIQEEFRIACNTERKPFRPPFWDGNSAFRCLKALLEYN